MKHLVYAMFRAALSLLTPGMIGMFIKSILLTLVVLVCFVTGASVFFNWLAVALHHHATASLLPWFGSIGAAAMAWMLFPVIMPILVSFYDDRIALLIERQDYPDSLQATDHSFWPELWRDVRFALLAIMLNVVSLPLYLMPGLNMLWFYWMNGYLLGREFFSIVARRHMPVRDSDIMYRRHRMIILIAGVLLAIVATLPLANLFAPFWGIALMVHLYHRLEPTVRIELVDKNPKILF